MRGALKGIFISYLARFVLFCFVFSAIFYLAPACYPENISWHRTKQKQTWGRRGRGYIPLPPVFFVLPCFSFLYTPEVLEKRTALLVGVLRHGVEVGEKSTGGPFLVFARA